MTCACTNTRKQKENNTTKTNEHRMSDDNNSENQDLREFLKNRLSQSFQLKLLDSSLLLHFLFCVVFAVDNLFRIYNL